MLKDSGVVRNIEFLTSQVHGTQYVEDFWTHLIMFIHMPILFSVIIDYFNDRFLTDIAEWFFTFAKHNTIEHWSVNTF